MGDAVYRTDLNGTVSMMTDGKSVKVITENRPCILAYWKDNSRSERKNDKYVFLSIDRIEGNLLSVKTTVGKG